MKRHKDMPSWAYWGLWGINSRKAAMLFFSSTIILSIIMIIVLIQKNIFDIILLLGMPLASLWYWVSIKWADKNNVWEE